MSEILRIENVRKYFGNFAAVDGISIGLKEGGIYLLVGPNGCGKTTLTNCISGIFHPHENQIQARPSRSRAQYNTGVEDISL
jgi:branched-chain amino acid transport system ATP-binding protein